MSGEGTSGERARVGWLIMLPMVIAALSLVSQAFQSWNYTRNIESAQRNVLRAEALKTCRDIIDVFFQFRLKAEEANRMREAMGAMLPAEMRALAYRFGAYGTFLANFQEDEARARYTAITGELSALAGTAQELSREDFAGRFDRAHVQFSRLNEDCVKAAQSRLL